VPVPTLETDSTTKLPVNESYDVTVAVKYVVELFATITDCAGIYANPVSTSI
jgi:hypothetical protein